MFDILIQQAQVVDGSGGPPFTADIAIQGDTIRAIGQLSAAETRTNAERRSGIQWLPLRLLRPIRVTGDAKINRPLYSNLDITRMSLARKAQPSIHHPVSNFDQSAAVRCNNAL